MSTSIHTTTLVLEHCYKCGVPFGLEGSYRGNLLNSHSDFWCPNGHRQHYIGKSRAEKLEQQLQKERERTEAARRDATRASQRARDAGRSAAAQKGVTTKLKKRIAAGVCPCCQRSFQNLHKHITSQHPEFVAEAGES